MEEEMQKSSLLLINFTTEPTVGQLLRSSTPPWLIIQHELPKQSESWLYLCHYHSVDIHYITLFKALRLVAGRRDFGCWALLRRASTAFINDAACTTSFSCQDRQRERRRAPELNGPMG